MATLRTTIINSAAQMVTTAAMSGERRLHIARGFRRPIDAFRLTVLPSMKGGRALLALFLATLLTSPCAHALDTVARLSDYQHTIWGAQQGAPGAVTTIAQTRDGWLWLGTSAGLFRFDGKRFERFAPATGPQLLNQRIASIWAADNGDLWISYVPSGMSILHEGHLIHIADDKPNSSIGAAFRMQMDVDGSMWAATITGLRHYTSGKWQIIDAGSGFPGPHADAVFLDHDGRLWVSNGRHTYLLDRASGKFTDSGFDGTAENMAESPDGRLWLGRESAWRVLPAPATGLTPMPHDFWLHESRNYGMFDRYGNHWQVGCPAGVCRTGALHLRDATSLDVTGAATDRFDQRWQMGSLAADTIFEDREGNIWVGTQAGLERFRYKKLRAVEVPDSEAVFRLTTDPQGQVWAATLPHNLLFKVGGDEPPALDRSHTYVANGTATDGSMLLADSERLERRQGDHSTYIALPVGPDGQPFKAAHPMSVAGDADSVWLGIASRGVFHLRDGKWEDVRHYGFSPKGTHVIVAGPSGDAWFGFTDGSILHVERSGHFTRMPASGVGSITMIEATSMVVVAGEQGIAFWRDGQFHRLHAADGAALNSISAMLVDAAGDHWFNGGKGVVHVRAADWAAAMQRPDQLLRYELLDALDGYPGSAQTAFNGPSAVKAADGRMWFVGSSGIVSLDPAQIRRNELPPPVVLTGLHTDIGTGLHAGVDDYPTASNPQLPAGTSGVRIDYAALSYVMPERLRFDYKLDGVDAHWLTAGDVREAYYRQLGPGTYRFHVRATNEEGVVSRDEAIMTFSIPPTFTQTLVFKLLCAAAAVALAYAVHAWRLRRVARYYEEQMRVRLAERERIARGLHDTLLQSMRGTLLRFHSISRALPVHGDARVKMEEVLDQADEAMLEGRRVITSLRATTAEGEDLNGALEKLGADLQDNADAQFKMSVQGETMLLDGALSEEIYFIAREAMLNAFQHANAREIELAITYGRTLFSLVVRDDGIGMDLDNPRQEAREGHWGLPGMQERARSIGAQFAMLSEAGRGTEITLRLEADSLYRSVPRANWRAKLARLLRRRR